MSRTLFSFLWWWLSADCRLQTHPVVGSFSQLLKSQTHVQAYLLLHVSMAQEKDFGSRSSVYCLRFRHQGSNERAVCQLAMFASLVWNSGGFASHTMPTSFFLKDRLHNHPLKSAYSRNNKAYQAAATRLFNFLIYLGLGSVRQRVSSDVVALGRSTRRAAAERDENLVSQKQT
ncbi:uncharacterized protein P174DRAFT_429013 [Aspergillus novofumigatus IBT 16806]|uniref:Secreted protein n=1 Tax=Aspergillus novofumigatus (strain IBT 16806) TaxID=1392255 RepID=A0A2I1CJ12_ASPN1|nr:uncharacterized protein P174DRAFT_429013 [Aspergillus novofumigatus IBT 16806]PKX97584.1 hypothetical protein P174DRAFT_429013 [Aspergillus novofumigatus IBT 16806]